MKKGILIGIVLFVFGLIYYFMLSVNENAGGKNILKIGVILPLTGEGAAYGKSSKAGIELAKEQLNLRSDVKIRYSLYFEDSKGLPKDAVSSFEALVTRYKVPIVIGPITSPEVLAVAPLAEKNKVVLISPGASSPDISVAGDYIFRNVPSDIYEPKVMADFIVNKLKYKNVAILYVNNEYGNGVKNVFVKEINSLGGTILSQVAYIKTTKSFRTYLETIKGKKPEAIYFIGYKELGQIIRQAKEVNLPGQYLSNSLFEDPGILKVAGDAAEGVIFTTFPFDIGRKDSVMIKFVSNYERKFHRIPDGFAAAAYEAFSLVDKAISFTNKTTSVSIKNGLYQIKNYNGLFGKISFDSNGDVIFPIQLKICKNNKFIKY